MDENQEWEENFTALSELIGRFQSLRSAPLPEDIKPEVDRIYERVERHLDALAGAFSEDRVKDIAFNSGSITALLDHLAWVLHNRD